MSSFCTAKATHIFSAKKIPHICVSLDVNFNEVVSFEQLGPGFFCNKVVLIAEAYKILKL